MAFTINKALPNLYELVPLDGTNCKPWSQKLLIFFEQLEVDCVLFFDLPKVNSISKTIVASADGTHKTTLANEQRLENLRKMIK